MKLTARAVAELLASHEVARAVACILGGEFQQDAVWQMTDEQGQALIKVFEDKRRALLEVIGAEHPDVLDAI